MDYPVEQTATQIQALFVKTMKLLTSNTEEAEFEWFYEDLQDLLELTTTTTKKCPFHHSGLESKSRKLRNT